MDAMASQRQERTKAKATKAATSYEGHSRDAWEQTGAVGEIGPEQLTSKPKPFEDLVVLIERRRDKIVEEFPDLTKEHIAACLDYARDLSEFEVAAA